VHPGYGFLSENTAFAAACAAAGIAFVGPPAAAIDAMGSKRAAKDAMARAGVPVLPGYHGDAQELDALAREAERVGLPLIVKPSGGGGGKGMQIVTEMAQLRPALEAARRLAASAFGDPTLLLERYVPAPRHVEVQVLADQHGHVLHLGTRDCSVQRRHQKLIEEAPAPGIAPEVRERLHAAAVTVARSIGYTNAGTVEFLYADGEFWFMEMNTRLQVEHPVTEAIHGLDLVEWQLRIAAGERLPFTQAALNPSGHAIEVRLCAEDPDADFVPSSGRLRRADWPERLAGCVSMRGSRRATWCRATTTRCWPR
jgi:3-methylcrotonyl-CoA carboxylase alpha subunit